MGTPGRAGRGRACRRRGSRRPSAGSGRCRRGRLVGLLRAGVEAASPRRLGRRGAAGAVVGRRCSRSSTATQRPAAASRRAARHSVSEAAGDLTSFSGDLGVDRADAVGGAPRGQPAGAAGRLLGVADPPAVEDHAVAEVGPLLLRHQLGDLGLDLDRVLLRGPAEPADQPAEVGVDGQPGDAEGVAEDDVGRLAARRPGRVTRSAIRPGTSPSNRSTSAWLRPRTEFAFARKKPVGLRISSSSARSAPAQGDGVGVAGEQRRRHLVDHLVGGLRRQHGGDQQLEGVGEVELAVRVGVDDGELAGHPPGPAGAGQRRLGRVERRRAGAGRARRATEAGGAGVGGRARREPPGRARDAGSRRAPTRVRA